MPECDSRDRETRRKRRKEVAAAAGGQGGPALPRTEAYLPWLLLRKAFLQKQLFGSQRAALTGRYISPDLVCFGCFGAAAIRRDRGLVIERTRFHSLFPARRPLLPSPPASLLFPYLLSTFWSRAGDLVLLSRTGREISARRVWGCGKGGNHSHCGGSFFGSAAILDRSARAHLGLWVF